MRFLWHVPPSAFFLAGIILCQSCTAGLPQFDGVDVNIACLRARQRLHLTEVVTFSVDTQNSSKARSSGITVPGSTITACVAMFFQRRFVLILPLILAEWQSAMVVMQLFIIFP
ncbi:MAG: hypothetical protein KGM99_17480 [Burkholderiales bacterium]|nr:hypothetical protein [Burkholderiales bacterium]